MHETGAAQLFPLCTTRTVRNVPVYIPQLCRRSPCGYIGDFFPVLRLGISKGDLTGNFGSLMSPFDNVSQEPKTRITAPSCFPLGPRSNALPLLCP